MLEKINNFEYKNLSIKGLDITKHEPQLDKLREKGWIIFRSSPDANGKKFKYKIKRPLTN